MPTDVFEESLDLRIGLLEAVAAASPYPKLRSTGQEESREFAAILLENAYLRVTILPGLGGRILSIFDKRTNSEILSPPSLGSIPGGARGVRIPAGIQLLFGAEDRPNDLGPVDVQVEEPPEAVWIAESAGGTGISFHLRIVLPDDRAELRFEARIFNRTRRPLPYNAALTFQVGGIQVDGETIYSSERRAGFRLRSNELEHGTLADGRLMRSRFSDEGRLGPRQVDAWSAVLTPFSGMDGLAAVADDAAAFVDSSRVQVLAIEPILSARILLGLADGQTLEAPADLYPEHVMEIPLDGLANAPVALAVVDGDRRERLRTALDRDLLELPTGGSAPISLDDPIVDVLDENDLRRLAFSTSHRALSHLERGHRALARGEFTEADEHLENALLYNADDPLNWWTKAMSRRLAGSEEEGPELPNAHYLAPLEPALRAEAFLTQSQNQGREPNPLVAPLKDKPEALVEVACLLLEIGVRAEASRWIDEALRHRDVAMLRYLLAWSLLGGSRMEAEAALHVAAAGRLLLEAPYPWREIEQKALAELSARFPSDVRLREYSALVEAGPTSRS